MEEESKSEVVQLKDGKVYRTEQWVMKNKKPNRVQNYFMFMDMTGDKHELKVIHQARESDGTLNRAYLGNNQIMKFVGTLEEIQENPCSFILPGI